MLIFASLGLVGCTVTSATTTDGATVDAATPRAQCTDWSKALPAGSVPTATGSVLTQRTQLIDAGGGVAPVGNRYFASYFSSGFAAAPKKRVLVALHGTGGAPEAEWSDYRSIIDGHGWGLLGLKYLDDATQIYDSDETIYANLVTIIEKARAECELGDAQFFVAGFSRGSAKTFAMAYLDKHGQQLFTAFGPQSGGAWKQPSGCAFQNADGSCGWQSSDTQFPTDCAMIAAGTPCTCSPVATATPPAIAEKPTFAETIVGSNERTAYAGSRFFLYCAVRDYEAGYRNCSDMEMSKAFVEAYGGHVEELYTNGPSDGCVPWNGKTCIQTPDTKCGHGSFKNTPNAVARMWTYFESL